MLSLSHVIAANEQQVAAKVMDGEAILINLTTGAYYSIPATGGFIWSLVEKKLSIDDIVGAVASHYDVARSQAEADVLRLGEELHSEGLVTVSPSAATSGSAPQPAGARLPYQAPTLEKFTDMAEMFALDPPLPGLANTQPTKK
jgi:hypothetical protein